MNRLKTAIRARKLKIYLLADQMHMTRGTLYRRFRQQEKLTLRELRMLRQLLQLSDSELIQIFFEEESHNERTKGERKARRGATL